MQTKEYPKDKYGYEIPRCHYVSPINGEDCKDVPMTGEHFCPSHNARLEAEIRLAVEGRLAPEKPEACPGRPPEPWNEPRGVPWTQGAGSFNHRQPQSPLRIPPNLPRVTVRTHSDVLYFYEDTINHVRQGAMDVRVANCLGNLAMGALATINSTIRAERWAMLDRERAAERAAQRAEQRAEQSAAKRAEPEQRPAKRTEPGAAGKKARQEAQAPAMAVPQEQKEDEAKKVENKEAERNEAERKENETKEAAKTEAEAAVMVPETAENKTECAAGKNEEATKSDDVERNEAAPGPVQRVYGFLVPDRYGRKRIIRPVSARAPESPAPVRGDVL
jgi:hypothetical protein